MEGGLELAEAMNHEAELAGVSAEETVEKVENNSDWRVGAIGDVYGMD